MPSISHDGLRPGLSVQANFVWTLGGSLVYSACQWGSLIVLTKLGSPDMVGQFALGLAIANPVLGFASLQLREIQATDARGEYAFADYVGLRVVTTALGLVVTLSIVLGLGYHRETAAVILAVAFAKALEAISDIFYGLFERHERMNYIARSLFSKGPLSLAALGVGMYLTGSVLGAVVGTVIAQGLVLVFHDVRTGVSVLRTSLPLRDRVGCERRQEPAIRPCYERRALLGLARLALPLGIAFGFMSLQSSIPRFLIERYVGEHALGIFAAIAYIPVSIGTLVSAMARSATPRLAKHYVARNSGAFRRLLLRLMGIALLLGCTGVVVASLMGRQVLTLFYSREYGAHQDILVQLMVNAGMTHLVWFLGCAMTATRHLRVQVPLLALQSAILALACLGLIPSHGLRGACTALVIAKTVQLVASGVVVAFLLWKLPSELRQEELTLQQRSMDSLRAGVRTPVDRGPAK